MTTMKLSTLVVSVHVEGQKSEKIYLKKKAYENYDKNSLGLLRIDLLTEKQAKHTWKVIH